MYVTVFPSDYSQFGGDALLERTLGLFGLLGRVCGGARPRIPFSPVPQNVDVNPLIFTAFREPGLTEFQLL